jgi:hypothetical protein
MFPVEESRSIQNKKRKKYVKTTAQNQKSQPWKTSRLFKITESQAA